MINTLIVDDEPLAREGLEITLQSFNNINIVGQCSNGAEAVKAIDSLKPHLVFLDIQMPGVNGFDVIEAIGADNMPLVVFLTAYDQHAVKAFQVHALDYLLKPLDHARLQQCIDRAEHELAKVNMNDQAQQLKELLNDTNLIAGKKLQQRIVVRNAGHVHFIQPTKITWVEASGDYVTLHSQEKDHLLRDTMHNMEKRLHEHGFQRIHRSTIVNLDCVAELIANDSGDYAVILKDGTQLKLSRSYREGLYTALNANT